MREIAQVIALGGAFSRPPGPFRNVEGDVNFSFTQGARRGQEVPTWVGGTSHFVSNTTIAALKLPLPPGSRRGAFLLGSPAGFLFFAVSMRLIAGELSRM